MGDGKKRGDCRQHKLLEGADLIIAQINTKAIFRADSFALRQ
jgi:hypothetical protein